MLGARVASESRRDLERTTEQPLSLGRVAAEETRAARAACTPFAVRTPGECGASSSVRSISRRTRRTSKKVRRPSERSCKLTAQIAEDGEVAGRIRVVLLDRRLGGGEAPVEQGER